jgi:adenine phosphoribosyltransferase
MSSALRATAAAAPSLVRTCQASLADLQGMAVQVPNYPKPGVIFQDLVPIYRSNTARERLLDEMAAPFLQNKLVVDVVAGFDSRGYILGTGLATRLDAGFVPILKATSKVPAAPEDCSEESYGTEYSKDKIKMPKRWIRPGDRVLLTDDLLASGGTAVAGKKLIEKLGGVVVGFSFGATLVGLEGVERLAGSLVFQGMHFDAQSGTPLPVQASPSAVASLSSSMEAPGSTKTNVKTVERTKNKTVPWSSHTVSSEKATLVLPVNRRTMHRFDRRGIVMFYPTMQHLAEAYVRKRGAHEWRLMRDMKWDSFPDETPDLLFEHRENLRDRDVVFFMDMTAQKALLNQMCVAEVLPKQDVRSLELIVPYFATSTHERCVAEGIVATADPMSKLMTQRLPGTRQGPVRFTVCDLHTLQQRFYFSNDATLRMTSAMGAFKRRLAEVVDKPVVIVLCDDGAYKRYGDAFREAFPVIVYNKVRDGEKRHMSLKDSWLPSCDAPFVQHDAQGKRCVNPDLAYFLVDDLVMSGSTLTETARALQTLGAQDLNCFAPHGIFPKAAHTRFVHGGADAQLFRRFWIGDTVPHMVQLQRKGELPAPFEILSTVDAFVPMSTDATSVVMLDAENLQTDDGHTNPKLVAQIILASKSPEKKAAVEALATLTLDEYDAATNLVLVPAASGVLDQPYGYYETWLGAMNRFTAARRDMVSKKQLGARHVLVAVENGAIPLALADDVTNDVACVVYYSSSTGEPSVNWSRPVAFPASAVVAWQQASKKGTIGQQLALQRPEISHTNWSRDIHGAKGCRINILTETLANAEMLNHSYHQ